jgi:uncharacterized Zn finger protein
MAAATRAAFRPHIIIAPMRDGRMRYYVRSEHAADVYYRVERFYGQFTCTCPIGQQRKTCKHLGVAARS